MLAKTLVEMSDGPHKAPLACLPCKVGKRQCDKSLPVCSRCRNIDRVCDYETPSMPPTAEATQENIEVPIRYDSWTSGVSMRSCVICRLHKRRCDRFVPNCSRCVRLNLGCEYGTVANRDRAAMFQKSQVKRITMNFSGAALAPGQLPGLDSSLDLPIPFASYMPRLLHFFLTSVALPSSIACENNLALHLRSQWMETAMSEPCLFHATLFSASASIDLLKQRQNSIHTIYHQAQTIRLINDRLARREPVLNYGTLGSVIPLLFYNMVALDKKTALAHQEGLTKMLLSIPETMKENLRSLIAIFKVAMLSFSCVFDTKPIWDCLLSPTIRTKSVLRSLVTSPSFNRNGNIFEKATIDSILDAYEIISKLDHLSDAEPTTISMAIEQVLLLTKSHCVSKPFKGRLRWDNVTRLNACCQLCSSIIWKLLNGRSQIGPEMPLASIEEIKLLREIMMGVDPSFWISKAPEALTWLTFTGAASSVAQSDRGVFVHYGCTILTAIDSGSLTLIRQGWRYFSLMRRLGGLGSSPMDRSCEEDL